MELVLRLASVVITLNDSVTFLFTEAVVKSCTVGVVCDDPAGNLSSICTDIVISKLFYHSLS